MIKKAIIAAAVITVMSISANVSACEDGWNLSIKAHVLNAENRLVVGQAPDAADDIDGRYDVPALLAGDIKAYMELEGKKYWKNIKESCNTPCKKAWNIYVESDALGRTIELLWNPSDIPDDISVILIDTATGEVTDMKTEHRKAYKNTGKREFTLEAQTR
ncbi:MAG TPA: hypothetical protein ENG83_04550 [Nitrospirae bacterium]|nr:hypothetical protein BMS3Abin06_00635 [bacterium BMS3Abin06]HDH11460.1 hypothetical protein [Nitrospirota bacterium]HDZ01386.1 hypothetical protein [Nitrospirota bacterium]